jgi:hypothetical protein
MEHYGAEQGVVRGLLGGLVYDRERVVVAQQRDDVVDPAPDVRLPHAQGDLLVEQGHHRHRVRHRG